MSFTFNRYTSPARRVIFFAREAALNSNAIEIDSLHILSGLILEDGAKEENLFRLGELFPEQFAQMRNMKRSVEPRDIPLTREAKRVLARSAIEADALDNYWIDTCHLMLGILREATCAAAVKLNGVGITLEGTRRKIVELPEQRPTHGPVPALWRFSKPITRVGHVAGIAYLLFIFVLIKMLTQRSC